MSHHLHNYHHKYSGRNYRPRRHRGRLRVDRLIILILIFAAIVTGIILGIMLLTKTGIFAASASEASVSESGTPFNPSFDAAPENISPAAVDQTQPSSSDLSFAVEQDGESVSAAARAKTVSFPSGNDYTDLAGVITESGNHFRSQCSYGVISDTAQSLELTWDIRTPESAHPASQPLVIYWDDDIRKIMNLYPEKQSQENLVEVICPKDDGTLSFIDLADGSLTRDSISLGSTIGNLSLDPRGYPLLYIGGGSDHPSVAIYSLLSGELLYQYDTSSDSFATSESEHGFSCSPLIAADADLLVWPSDNGILYTFGLNSDFDRAAGSVSVNPDAPVKYKYERAATAESTDQKSPSITGLCAWRNYAFITDDAGYLQCIDLNTMTPIYVQHIDGVFSSSPLLEETADGIYLYAGTASESGNSLLCKINGLSGEIIWQRSFPHSNKGGILSTPAMGYGALKDTILCTLVGADDNHSVVYSLSANTGEILWECKVGCYTTVSPIPIYTQNGNVSLFVPAEEKGLLLSGDGKLLNSLDLSGYPNAPAVLYNNAAVFGEIKINLT